MTYKGINAISISSYNDIRALSGEKSVSLANNEVLISSNLGEVENTLKNILKNNEKIEIDGKEYNGEFLQPNEKYCFKVWKK